MFKIDCVLKCTTSYILAVQYCEQSVPNNLCIREYYTVGIWTECKVNCNSVFSCGLHPEANNMTIRKGVWSTHTIRIECVLYMYEHTVYYRMH